MSFDDVEKLHGISQQLLGIEVEPEPKIDYEIAYPKTRVFVDKCISQLKAGNGGNGCVSFFRGPNKPRGPPDGGNGGNGGSITVKVSKDLVNLSGLKTLYQAPHGKNGQKRMMHGKDGQNLEIFVPPGTTIWSYDSTTKSTQEVIADLDIDQNQFELARGGIGGKGNPYFASPKVRSPTVAEPGLPGESKKVLFELKTIADIGLVGFPNAGKSSLLKAVSNALPKIANYPFTTINPYVGTIQYPDFESLRIADLPGIISGASQGFGLGHEFLKHIERTSALCFVIDLAPTYLGTRFSTSNRSPVEDYSVLIEELELYNPSLLTKPIVILGNKIDVGPTAIENWNQFVKTVDPDNQKIMIPISAKEGTNIDALKGVFFKMLLDKNFERF